MVGRAIAVHTEQETTCSVRVPDRQSDAPPAFLFPSHDRPAFGNDHERVTHDAADNLAVCFNKLLARHITRDEARRFILQMLVGLFAEDIDLLPPKFGPTMAAH